jgi:hypothetical protein
MCYVIIQYGRLCGKYGEYLMFTFKITSFFADLLRSSRYNCTFLIRYSIYTSVNSIFSVACKHWPVAKVMLVCWMLTTSGGECVGDGRPLYYPRSRITRKWGKLRNFSVRTFSNLHEIQTRSVPNTNRELPTQYHLRSRNKVLKCRSVGTFNLHNHLEKVDEILCSKIWQRIIF